jgi:hypothetical protein
MLVRKKRDIIRKILFILIPIFIFVFVHFDGAKVERIQEMRKKNR